MVFYFGKINYKRGKEVQRLPHLLIKLKIYMQQGFHNSDIKMSELRINIPIPHLL